MSFRIGDIIRWTTSTPNPDYRGKRARIIGPGHDAMHLSVELIDDPYGRDVPSGIESANILYMELIKPRGPYTSNEPGDFPRRQP